MKISLPLGRTKRFELLSRRQAGHALVALEFDIASERNPSEAPARATSVKKAGNLRSKSDGKCFNLYAQGAGCEKMAEFVNNDNNAKHQEKRDRPPKELAEGGENCLSHHCVRP